MTEVEARPRFYEGQFLAAADLTAAVDYTRTQRARMLLGAHRWGIAVGMDLVEVPGPNSSLDVVVTPGYAWDGFGRPIVVGASTRLPTALFARIDALVPPGGGAVPPVPVEVWIRYDETLGQGPRPGFETCDGGSAYSRVSERFVLEAGPRDLAAQRDHIEVAGRSMDATQALRTFDPAAPEVVDASIPHQVLPEEGEPALWLVPLGVVLYQPAGPGKSGTLVKRDPATLQRHAVSREYAGVVAGSVEATAGSVRVHDRGKPYSTFRTEELLQVEGEIRSDGDVRIFGHALSFVASHAESPRQPLQVLRRDDLATGAASLTLVIGEQQAGKNRLVVARKSGADSFETKLVVTDQGRVGVGTEEPKAPLHLTDQGLQIGTSTTATNNFALQVGDGPRALRFLNGDSGSGTPVVTVTATGRLGIGATDPSNMVHVRGSLGLRQNAMYLSGDSRWSSLTFNAHHDTDNIAWVFPDTAKPAVTVEMDAVDGYPRFEVWATQPGLENKQWAPRLHVNGHTGNVGIGTRSPSARLDVAGNLRFDGLDAVGAESRTRLVWGGVKSTGTSSVPGQFTAVRTAEGRYVVTFAAPFAGPPVVVASRVYGDIVIDASTGAEPGETVVVDQVLSDRVVIVTANKAAVRADGGFTFIAIGPRP